MQKTVRFLIIGGGVAGLSTAYHLAAQRAGSVLLLEREARLGGHASGRNAGMIRQTVEDVATARMAVQSRQALSRWKAIGFENSGSLLLAKGKTTSSLAKIRRILKGLGVRANLLKSNAAAARVSLLKNADFEQALFCPTDALVDIDLLLKQFLIRLKKRNVEVGLGEKPRRIYKRDGFFYVETDKGQYRAQYLVNAAGAWAGPLGKQLSALEIPFKAYRRHLFLTVPGKRENWPFVWDLSHEFYFRPQGASLLLSPCDNDFFKLNASKKDALAEKTDQGKKQDLLKKLSRFSGRPLFWKLRGETAGLRTMTDDGRFVIGEDPKVAGFFWVAGLGGHGMTTCLAVGKLASDLLLKKNKDVKSAKAFSPRRFLKKGAHAS